MIKLLSYDAAGEETFIILTGADEESFLNIIVSRLATLGFELFIVEDDSLIPYEDYHYES